MEPVLAPGAWQAQVLAVSASALVVPGVVRSLWPSRPLAGLLSGLVAGASVLLGTQAGSAYPQAWWHAPGETLEALRLSILTGVPPVEVSGVLRSGLLLTCLLLSWACAVLSAGGADTAAATGLVPTSLMLLPVVVRGQVPSRSTFLLVAACLLALVVTAAPARYWPSRSHVPGRSHGPSAARRLAAAAMGVLALVLGICLVDLRPATSERAWTPREGEGSIPELSLTLSQDLLRGSSETALSYSGNVPQGASLRLTLAVIASLEGDTWEPERRTGAADVTRLQPAEGQAALTPGGALTRAGVGSGELRDAYRDQGPGAVDSPAGSLTVLRVRVQSLSTRQLPVLQSTALVAEAAASGQDGDQDGRGSSAGAAGAAAREPSVPRLEQWHWVEGTSTAASGTEAVGPGAAYTLLGWNAAADGSGRPAQVPVAPGPVAAELLAPYTSLPEDTPESVVQKAREVVARDGREGTEDSGGSGDAGSSGGAEEAASQAAALAAWLRGGDFTYDESAPYDTGTTSSMGLVERFLEQRHGYCVHYASAFAVMARSLGLPTRVAVGYASVSQGPGRWTQVTGAQLHAWPEVWVEGAGWVAYEPTPGGAGAALGPADHGTRAPDPDDLPAAPDTAASSARSPASSALPAQDGSVAPATTPPSWAAASGRARQAGPGLALAARRIGAVALVLACLAAPAGVRGLQRRRRRQRVVAGREGAAAAWAELVALGRDLRLLQRAGQEPRALTHEAVAERLVAALADPPTGLSGARGLSQADDARGAVLLLTGAVVAERYGPQAQEPQGQGIRTAGRDPSAPRGAGAHGTGGRAAPGDREELLGALAQASAALRGAAGRSRRILALTLPASLLPCRRGRRRR